MSRKPSALAIYEQCEDISLCELPTFVRTASELADSDITEIPVLGCISAGYGDPIDPEAHGSIPFDLTPLDIRKGTRIFALKVRGDSMKDVGIFDGDTVIVETREPKLGDIVAALIDGEVTLKRFVSSEGQLYLKAENPDYSNLIPMRQLVIQGVVGAVLRPGTSKK